MQPSAPSWKSAQLDSDGVSGQLHQASNESRAVRDMRDALGAVAVAEPAMVVLRAEADGQWHLRHRGQSEELRFPNRECALRAARLAVVRCTAYWLRVEDGDGEIHDEFLNWPPSAE